MSEFDEFTSEPFGLGRESHWFRQQVALYTVISYLDHTVPSRVLDMSDDSGHLAIQLASSSIGLEGPGWIVDIGAGTPEVRHEIASMADARGCREAVGTIQVLNPRDLRDIQDETFDVVVSRGQLAESKTKNEHERLIRDMARVAKPSGHVIVSYRSRPYQTLLALRERPRPSAGQLEQLVRFQPIVIDQDTRSEPTTFDGKFYTSTLEIVIDLKRFGVHTIEVMSADGIASWVPDEFWQLTRESGPDFFPLVRNLVLSTADNDYIADLCPEALLVGEKI